VALQIDKKPGSLPEVMTVIYKNDRKNTEHQIKTATDPEGIPSEERDYEIRKN